MLTESLQVAAPAEIALRVAAEIAELVLRRREQGRTAVLALPAGSTPRSVYAELGRRHREERLSFSGVIVFALDEYLGLASSHPLSFRRYFEDGLFRAVDLPAENAHTLDGDLHPAQVAAHCRDYERSIQDVGGIDLALLGLGVNGHVAFNEPGAPADSRTRAVELGPVTRERAASAFGGLENVPREGLTMGLATLRDARAVRLVVTGAAKRDVLGRVLAARAPALDLPATWLLEHPDFAIHADPAALQS